MSDKLTLDRETFKVLAADTRIDILKRLSEHKLTLTDLSERMGMSPSTIKEHLDRLVEVGLIEQMDRGTKWKYYRLTSKGKDIVSPQETKVWILLGTSLLVMAGAALSLFTKLGSYTMAAAKPLQAPLFEETAPRMMLAVNDSPTTLTGPPFDKAVEYGLRAAGGVMDNVTSTTLAEDMGVQATPTTLLPRMVESAALHLPWLELTIIGLCLLAFGYCMGRIMRKRVTVA